MVLHLHGMCTMHIFTLKLLSITTTVSHVLSVASILILWFSMVTRNVLFDYMVMCKVFILTSVHSANWNAVSRQIWRGCHTSVDSGDLNQAPPKQSALCSTCIIPALPVNCQFIWMACAFGMSATQPILG